MSDNKQPLPKKPLPKGEAIENHSIESYEAAIAELEMIVNKMETGNLPLEASLNNFKRGTELLKMCQQSLTDAEQQVSILSDSNSLRPIMLESEDAQ